MQHASIMPTRASPCEERLISLHDKKKIEKLAWLLVLIEADNHEADAQPPAALPAIPASTSSCQHVSADARVNKGGICFHEIPRYRLNFFGDSACPQQKLKIPHLDWQRSNPPTPHQTEFIWDKLLSEWLLFVFREESTSHPSGCLLLDPRYNLMLL